MPKRVILLSLVLFVAGCRAQSVGPLPTLAVLPSVTPVEQEPQRMAFWQVVDGTLAAADQIDEWQFTARAGDLVALHTLGAVNLVLRAPDGRILGTGTQIEVIAPLDGDYTVQVQLIEGDSGRYQLELAYSDRPNPADMTATPPPVTISVPTPTPLFSDLGLFIAQLQNGVPVAETFLNNPVQPHVFTFDGRAGDYVSVQMSHVSGRVDPVLTLYDPAGNPLAVDDNSGGNRTALLRNIMLRQDGLYSLQARGGNVPGDYHISLTSGSRPVPVTPTIIAPPTATRLPDFNAPHLLTAVPNVPLTPRMPVIGSLVRAGDVKRHPIVVAAGAMVTIGLRKLEPEANLLLLIEVYNPLGERVAAASIRDATSAGDILLPLLNMTEGGTYSVFVSGERSTSGEYVISYGVGVNYEDVARGPAMADTPYDGQIARRGLRDVWLVALNRGDVITVAANPTNNALDSIIELVAPDGTLVASDDNGGGFPNALLSDILVPTTGLYRLVVSAASGSSAGPYRLIWRYVNAAPTPTFDPPRILLFTIEDEVAQGQYQFYPFQGVAGQRVRIRVIGQVASGFDPVAALIGPDGNVIAEADDVGTDLNPQFTVDLPAEGTYQVRVNGYLSGGPFELVVERLF